MSSNLMDHTLKPSDIFNCRQCGKCCLGYGGTYISDNDILRIAKFLNITENIFKENYCCKSGQKFVLGQKKNGYCILWDQVCTIHSVKPEMCRAWPFINALKADISNWKIMGTACPGIQTDIPEEMIKQVVSKELAKNK